ncbi:MAG TPA: hypothetical protein VGC92_04490 [Phenylobacterium sp.]
MHDGLVRKARAAQVDNRGWSNQPTLVAAPQTAPKRLGRDAEEVSNAVQRAGGESTIDRFASAPPA